MMMKVLADIHTANKYVSEKKNTDATVAHIWNVIQFHFNAIV